MIEKYGFSETGKSHTKNGTKCQDSHSIKRLSNDWIVAAVADGVGSAVNSAIGSEIAVKTVISVCEKFMPYDNSVESIKEMLYMSYNHAFKMIINEASRTGEPIESYDTTLSAVIFDGHRIVYAHSGDGAIIGLNLFGDFIQITKPQKDIDGISVIPLRAGRSKWVIDSYEEDLASVMLMTDGIFEQLCHHLLQFREDYKCGVYVPLASFFADPTGFSNDANKNEEAKKIIKQLIVAEDDNSKGFYDRLLEIYKHRVSDNCEEVMNIIRSNMFPTRFIDRIEDDKTLVCLINTEANIENKDVCYYAEPDWDTLNEKWRRLAYPHLYNDKERANVNVTKNKSKGKRSKGKFVRKYVM